MAGWRAVNPFAPLRLVLTLRPLIPMLLVLLVINLVGQSYTTVWVLFAEARFNWSTAEVGVSLAAFGMIVALVQTFAVGPLTRTIGARGTLLLGLACETVGLLTLGLVTAHWIGLPVVPLIAMGRTGIPAI